MFCFDPKRFCKLDLRYHDVTAPIIEPQDLRIIEVHVLSQYGAAIDTFVVDGNLVLCDIIVVDHLTRANNDHLAYLLRIQPTDMNVCDYLPGIFKAEKNNIINAVLHVSHALATNGERLRITEPI